MKKIILTAIALLSIAALSAGAYPPPEDDEMTLRELESKIFKFDGKVIEVEITYGWDITHKSARKASIYCRYTEAGRYDGTGTRIDFIKDSEGEALEFFEDIVKSRWSGGRKSFYVLVEGKNLTAIGERYKKSKGTYSW